MGHGNGRNLLRSSRSDYLSSIGADTLRIEGTLTSDELLKLVKPHPTSLDIDPRDVPEKLRALIPYAKIWGLPDDDFRGEIFQETSAELLNHIREVQALFDDDFDDWLAGPEADDPDNHTNAYTAFSSWRMGLDGSIRKLDVPGFNTVHGEKFYTPCGQSADRSLVRDLFS